MLNNVILIVIGSFKTGGAERMAINTGEQLRKQGFEIHYALQRGIFELPHNIESHFIHVFNNNINRNKYIVHLRSIIGLFLLNLKLLPNAIIGFTYYSSFISTFTFHPRIIGRFDANPYIIPRKLRHRIANYMVLWPFVRKIVVPSIGLKDQISSFHPKYKNKFVSIHNSIDESSILSDSNEDVKVPFERYIIGIGRLKKLKNFELLLQAYAQSGLVEDFGLVIVGDGEWKEQLISLSRSLKIEEKVFFTGNVKNPFPIIRKAHVLVNTSNAESFCNVIVEAFCLSVPVIATDCDFGPREIIGDSNAGVLVPINNIEFLIKELNDVCLNEGRHEGMKKHTYKVVNKFLPSSIGKVWEDLFVQLAK